MTQILSGDTNTPMMNERRKGTAIVIGGGFGGLATAIRLQAAGHAVTLVEARERLGGRAYQLKKDGFTFDMGPSLITAPHLLEDIWKAAGRTSKRTLPCCRSARFIVSTFRMVDISTIGEPQQKTRPRSPNLSHAMYKVIAHFLPTHNEFMSALLRI